MRLFGVPVSRADCRTLVNPLLRIGRADDLERAGRIDHPAITRLIITDALVGSRWAGSITHFMLGPRNQDSLRILIEWETEKTPSNVEPTRHRIEGD
jgi:hypothetical protein